ncbi:MAG: hypothetical protein ABSC94_18340 [Polyangiaceae bacterium]
MSSVIESPIGVIRQTPVWSPDPASLPPSADAVLPSGERPESAGTDESAAASGPESRRADELAEVEATVEVVPDGLLLALGDPLTVVALEIMLELALEAAAAELMESAPGVVAELLLALESLE